MKFPALSDVLPTLEVEPTVISLFRFSAVTWNPHRIHYDREYAAFEGYDDVLVQGHLHGSWLLTAVRSWIGDRGRVERFSWQNRGIAVPGDRLLVQGRVTAVNGDVIEIELTELNQHGRLCTPGRATIRLVSKEYE